MVEGLLVFAQLEEQLGALKERRGGLRRVAQRPQNRQRPIEEESNARCDSPAIWKHQPSWTAVVPAA